VSAITKAEGHYSETEIDEEVVVMSLESGDFFSLTGTAREIWRLIDGSRDRAALVTALANEYGAAAEEVAPDVDAFLGELAEAGLIGNG
jgi:pyrroloquinoline quinone biosynthesis protein D